MRDRAFLIGVHYCYPSKVGCGSASRTQGGLVGRGERYCCLLVAISGNSILFK
jgi:hypothetical protein